MIKMRKRKCPNDRISDVYTVETIYKKKIRNNKEPLYYIKWKDWEDKYNTWEPLSNILDHSLIETFEEEIREKKKSRKEASKKKKLDWDKVDYESDVKSESPDEIDITVGEQLIDNSSKDDYNKCDLTSEEIVLRPKICLKIPKYRLHQPHSSTFASSLSNEPNSPDMEKSRNVVNQSDEDQLYICPLTPSYVSQDHDLNQSIKDESPKPILNSPKKSTLFNIPQKHLIKLDSQIRKPKKLLSINEYSAVIKMKKKHHKKSKHSKHRSENRSSQSRKDRHKPNSSVENNIPQKPETKRSVDDKPLLSLENKMLTWPKSRLGEPILKNIELKLRKPFQFNSQTTVTDVTVGGLSVTVKEMSYDDFINDSYPRFQLIRIPVNSDWSERYFGELDDKQEIESQSTENEGSVQITAGSNIDETLSKQRLLDIFEERIIPGLRPPSRPRSVDSYRNIMDKTMYGMNRNLFTESLSKVDEPSRVLDTAVSQKEHHFANSPLNVTIDESEEVDVVGGIESENSYLSSLQSSTQTTVTTQLRQDRLTANQNPVSSIIQSLWHSYSYNSPMTMPPLQAAPWVQQQQQQQQPSPDDVMNHTYQLSRTPHPFITRSSSIDTTVLNYSQRMPLPYYHQSSNLLSSLYMTNNDDAAIDLSFK